LLLLSVIVPSRDSVLEKHSSIGFTVQSLLCQKNVLYELIVVDLSQTERNAELVGALHPSAKVIRLSTSNTNPALPRNTGAAAASGELLLFLDDDTVLSSPDTLQKTVAALDGRAFACGAKRFWSSVYWWRHLRLDQPFSASLATLREISILPCGINPLVGFRDLCEFTFIGNYGVIRREAFDAVGGFDAAYAGWGMEDTDLMMRLCLAGHDYKILGGEDVAVYHLGHGSSNRDFRQNLARFNELERAHGKWFHVNHFFGVYEADGYALFSDV
jgi:GT2 family glycosyltransferase